jgi:hypothetical protein
VYTLKKNSSVSGVIFAGDAASSLPGLADIEYYRADSIPSTGHFLQKR